MTRFTGISLGYDVKSNQKRIKLTPGPGEYESKEDSVTIPTHNYLLNKGGLKQKEITPKEELMQRSFISSVKQPPSTRNASNII